MFGCWSRASVCRSRRIALDELDIIRVARFDGHLGAILVVVSFCEKDRPYRRGQALGPTDTDRPEPVRCRLLLVR